MTIKEKMLYDSTMTESVDSRKSLFIGAKVNIQWYLKLTNQVVSIIKNKKKRRYCLPKLGGKIKGSKRGN